MWSTTSPSARGERATRPESRGTTPVVNDGPVGAAWRKARDRRRGRTRPRRSPHLARAASAWAHAQGSWSVFRLRARRDRPSRRTRGVSGARHRAGPGHFARRSRVGTPYGGASAAEWIAMRSSPHFPFQPRKNPRHQRQGQRIAATARVKCVRGTGPVARRDQSMCGGANISSIARHSAYRYSIALASCSVRMSASIRSLRSCCHDCAERSQKYTRQPSGLIV